MYMLLSLCISLDNMNGKLICSAVQTRNIVTLVFVVNTVKQLCLGQCCFCKQKVMINNGIKQNNGPTTGLHCCIH